MKKLSCICALLIGLIFTESLNAGETYTNPVLVRTFNITRANPDHFTGILGIGDPSVIYYDGRYYLYPTGDNRSYDVYISSDLVNWRTGPKVFEGQRRLKPPMTYILSPVTAAPA